MNKLIAVVDDEPWIRVVVCQALREAGYLTQQFIDGQDFLDGLNPYVAAVVLGIMMPRLTGVDVLRWLRRHRPGLPVVTMSGGLYRDSEDELLALGAKAHLPKPFRPEAMVEAVNSLFR
jgi:DNA-binding response OmpR family regulator